MFKRGVVWFRNDLRIRDNLVLAKAIESCQSVVGIYCLDPDKWQKDELGFPRIGIHRTQFLIETLSDLRLTLRAKGSDLVILYGKSELQIPTWCKNHLVEELYVSYEHSDEEKHESLLVSDQLRKHGIAYQSLQQASLFNWDDLPFEIHELPDIFTNFRKLVEKKTPVREEVSTIRSIDGFTVENSNLPQLSNFGYSDASFSVNRYPFKGGENAALDRLKHYLWKTEAIANYKQTRNGLLGTEYASRFSSWLALGALSPRTIYWEVRNFEKEVKKNQSTYWMIFELIWRDYFRLVAKKFGNSIFLLNGIRKIKNSYNNDSEAFEKWKDGQTGIPFIDANMLELKETGFMSNRGRQNVASFLVKDLNLDWRWGARWFESQLVDYDVYSNWGNWTYVAGVGNDPRDNRYFNIYSQATRYDADGSYVRHWFPELREVHDAYVHLPCLISDLEKVPKRFRNPIIDISRWL